MKQNLKSTLLLLLKLSFSFCIIGYMIYSGRLDLQAVSKGFSQIHVLLFCIGLVVTATFVAMARWGLLLRAQDVTISIFSLIRYGMIGSFFNTTMPGAVSGDLIKAWYILSESKASRKTPILTSILLDRIFGVFGLILVSVSPILLFLNEVKAQPGLWAMGKIVFLLFLFVVCFFLYLFFAGSKRLYGLRESLERFRTNRIGDVVLSVHEAFLQNRNSLPRLALSIFLSMLNHFLLTVAIIFCAGALGDQKVELYKYFLLVPIGLLTTAVPIAPAGLGVGHVAFGALFELVGSTHGAEVFTMFVTVQILVNLTGVFFYIGAKKIPDEESSALESTR